MTFYDEVQKVLRILGTSEEIDPNQIVDHRTDVAEEYNETYVKTKKEILNMATIVLNVPDESLVSKVKQVCKMLQGVASVKVVGKREKSQACLNFSEREQAQAKLKVQRPKSEDITKTAGYKEAMDDVKHGRVTEYASLKDFYKEMGL